MCRPGSWGSSRSDGFADRESSARRLDVGRRILTVGMTTMPPLPVGEMAPPAPPVPLRGHPYRRPRRRRSRRRPREALADLTSCHRNRQDGCCRGQRQGEARDLHSHLHRGSMVQFTRSHANGPLRRSKRAVPEFRCSRGAALPPRQSDETTSSAATMAAFSIEYTSSIQISKLFAVGGGVAPKLALIWTAGCQVRLVDHVGVAESRS